MSENQIALKKDVYKRQVIALALLLLSLSLFLDSKNSNPETPLIDHWLRLAVHILLIFI